MTPTLRERLAATICSDNEDAAADRCIDVLERWLAERKLRIVPVDPDEEMFEEGDLWGDADEIWQAMIAAAPSNAEQMGDQE